MGFFRFIMTVIINNTVRLLSVFVKKDYNLWLFSDAGGKMFSGNIWYFYEYVKENHKDIKTICFANTKERTRETDCTSTSISPSALRETDLPVIELYSF